MAISPRSAPGSLSLDVRSGGRLHIHGIKEMPAGYDAEVAELFRDLRAASGLTEADLAAQLATRLDVVQALEQGAIYALPPWPETCRVVSTYGTLLNLDVRPLLRRIYAQVEAGIVELAPKPMPDVPFMAPPEDMNRDVQQREAKPPSRPSAPPPTEQVPLPPRQAAVPPPRPAQAAPEGGIQPQQQRQAQAPQPRPLQQPPQWQPPPQEQPRQQPQPPWQPSPQEQTRQPQPPWQPPQQEQPRQQPQPPWEPPPQEQTRQQPQPQWQPPPQQLPQPQQQPKAAPRPQRPSLPAPPPLQPQPPQRAVPRSAPAEAKPEPKKRRWVTLLKWGLIPLIVLGIATGLWLWLAKPSLLGFSGSKTAQSGAKPPKAAPPALDPNDPRSRKADRLPGPS